MKVVWGMMIALLVSIWNVVSFSGVIGYTAGGGRGGTGTFTVCIRNKGDVYMLNV